VDAFSKKNYQLTLNLEIREGGPLMRTIIKNRMIFVIFTLISIFISAVSLNIPQAGAEEVKFKIINYVTKMENLPVGDKEGHVLSLWERRGVAIFEKAKSPRFQ
jgi:hypothetical protein